MTDTAHPNHEAIVQRLKKARGHLNKVIKMIEGEQHCTEVARQLQAVSKAVYNAKQVLIRDHIDHCLTPGALQHRSAREIHAELAEITKYL